MKKKVMWNKKKNKNIIDTFKRIFLPKKKEKKEKHINNSIKEKNFLK